MEYGFWSLVPPLLTIILALTTKNVFISLFIGFIPSDTISQAFRPHMREQQASSLPH